MFLVAVLVDNHQLLTRGFLLTDFFVDKGWTCHVGMVGMLIDRLRAASRDEAGEITAGIDALPLSTHSSTHPA